MTMGPIERVLAAVGCQPIDHPPLALSLALQAGRTTGRPLPEVLRDPDAFVEAQLAMHRRWRHEVALAMSYAAVEAEAFGAPVAFFEDGPPNVAGMILRHADAIPGLRPPDVATSSPLQDTLRVVEGMKAGLAGQALVAGVAVGPISGPVMLMGMEPWMDLLMTQPSLAAEVVARYRDFALAWAAAQIERGADALVWFEPLASSELLPDALVHQLAAPALREACGLGVPLVLHLASARALARLPLALESGVALLSIGRNDPPAALAKAASGRQPLVGGLDGVAMSGWEPAQARVEVQRLRERFPTGLVLSDLHGEIPWQVAPETIDALVEAARA